MVPTPDRPPLGIQEGSCLWPPSLLRTRGLLCTSISMLTLILRAKTICLFNYSSSLSSPSPPRYRRRAIPVESWGLRMKAITAISLHPRYWPNDISISLHLHIERSFNRHRKRRDSSLPVLQRLCLVHHLFRLPLPIKVCPWSWSMLSLCTINLSMDISMPVDLNNHHHLSRDINHQYH